MTCKQILDELQAGSHREVERQMPSSALFKVQATLIFYASATEGMTNTKMGEGISKLVWTTEISKNLSPNSQQLNLFHNFRSVTALVIVKQIDQTIKYQQKCQELSGKV